MSPSLSFSHHGPPKPQALCRAVADGRRGDPAPGPGRAGPAGALRRRARSDERPPAPWGTFPLGELTTLAGIVVLVVGFFSKSGQLLAVGFSLVALSAAELAAREHFAGFRSHSALLGLILGAVTAVVLVVVGAPRPLQIGLAVAVFLAGFWAMRRVFQSSRAGGSGVPRVSWPQAADDARRMRLTGLHHVTAITKDLDAITAFYRDVLGLALVAQEANPDDPEARHFWFGDADAAAGRSCRSSSTPSSRRRPPERRAAPLRARRRVGGRAGRLGRVPALARRRDDRRARARALPVDLPARSRRAHRRDRAALIAAPRALRR